MAMSKPATPSTAMPPSAMSSIGGPLSAGAGDPVGTGDGLAATMAVADATAVSLGDADAASEGVGVGVATGLTVRCAVAGLPEPPLADATRLVVNA
jgi:hypothetical protein